MHLEVLRYNTTTESTSGLLFVNGRFEAYVLEDTQRFEKVAGETRIPSGTYEVRLRIEGSLTKKYGEKYPTIHRGMLWLQGVPGFTNVYVHVGNSNADTAGCLLIGDSASAATEKSGKVTSSGNAYKRLYPAIADAIESGEGVQLSIRSFA